MPVLTDGSRNFRRAVFVLAQKNELSFADGLCVVMPWVMEPVNTHLNCAIALLVIDQNRLWNEFSGHFGADIVLYTIGQSLFTDCHSTLIVVKLHIFGEIVADVSKSEQL